MGLTAVRSVLCLFLHTERVHKFVLDCPCEAEELKVKRYPDLKNVKNGDDMNSYMRFSDKGLGVHLFSIYNWCIYFNCHIFLLKTLCMTYLKKTS